MIRHRIALALLATAIGCSDDTGLRDALDALPRDTVTLVASSSPPEPVPVDTVPTDTASMDTSWLGGDTTALPIPFPEALDTEPWIPLGRPTMPGEWTAGVLRRERPRVEMTVQTGIRTAEHDEFERVVLEFAGDGLPGYHLEYVDRPIRQCGSGNPVTVAGDAWLQVRLTPAQAHDDRGRATIQRRDLRPSHPNLRELRLICDFEGQVEWVLGLRSPGSFRVLELSEPARLVVDVRR